jgi:hypothetical protein
MQFVDRGFRSSSSSSSSVDSSILMQSFQEEYVAQNESLVGDPSFRLWNQSFAAASLLMHLVLAAAVCSPVSSHMLLSISLLFLVSISTMVQPLENYSSSQGDNVMAMTSVTSQKVMLLGGIYLSAIFIVLSNISVDTYSAKVESVLLIAFLDGFMLFGHLWDKVPTLQVIINCRLLYITLLAIFNAGLLCVWDPYMKTPFMSGSHP